MALFLFGTPHSSLAFKGMGSSQSGDGRQSLTGMAAQHQGGQDIVIALVNGAEITMGPLMSTVMDVLMQKYGGKEVTEEIARNIRKEALEKLAIEELAWQRAVALGISVDEAVINARIQALTTQSGGEDAFTSALALQKKTSENIRNEIRRYMAVKEAISREVYSKATVEDKEVNRIYEENRDQFTIPEQMTVSDIIFFLDAEDEESRKQVDSIRQKIIEEHENNFSALQPDGFVVKTGLKISKETAPSLYRTAINMKPGETSAPVIIDATFHLVRLDMYKPAEEKPETEVKAFIHGKLLSKKRDEALAKWRQSLLKDAKIEIVHELLK